jgi:hypothetical protein
VGVITILDIVLAALQKANASTSIVVQLVNQLKALHPQQFPDLTTDQVIEKYRSMTKEEVDAIDAEVARVAQASNQPQG